MNLRLPSLLLLVGCWVPTTTNGQLEAAGDIAHYIPLGLGLVEHLYQLGQKLFKDSNFNLDIDLGRGFEREILREIKLVYEVLDKHSSKLEAAQESLRELTQLPRVVRWQQRMDRLAEYMRVLLSLDRTFHTYQTFRDQLNPTTLQNFAQQVVGHDSSSVGSVLDYIHDMVVPYDAITGQGMFTMQLDVFKNNPQMMCSTKQSPAQLLYSLYNLIAITEIKGYTMMHFSWLVLQLHNKGNFSEEAKIARDDLMRRSREKAAVAQEVMSKMTAEYWRCDPDRYEEGTNYLQMTRLLQGYIENELDLNTHETCKQTCGYYTYARSETCYKNLFCAQQKRCKGRVVDCQFIDSDSTVCLSDSPNRRYDWVEYENGRVLGNKGSCSRSKKVDSWWRWIFWHCSYCFCFCDEAGADSDRYFSMKESLADMTKNKVVTGVRWVKVNRIFHIQVQQGVALTSGGVNESTVAWVNVPAVSIDSGRDGTDYHMMSGDRRGLDLDDLHVPESHVVTGVRMRRLGTNLNLEIRATAMDFVTGKLKPAVSLWISNDNTPAALKNPRQKLTLREPDVPTKARAANMPDSRSGQYLEFTHTSLGKDVAQTTVPFIDAQPVAVQPPSWLDGIGIMHRGTSGYGGFVSLKVFTTNYTNYLEEPIVDMSEFQRLVKEEDHEPMKMAPTTTLPPVTTTSTLQPSVTNTKSSEDDRNNEV